MRADVTRWMAVVVTTLAAGGCYTNGQWVSPMAYWKTSPFQSSSNPDSTPGAPGDPVKPAGIAAGSPGNFQLRFGRGDSPKFRLRFGRDDTADHLVGRQLRFRPDIQR